MPFNFLPSQTRVRRSFSFSENVSENCSAKPTHPESELGWLQNLQFYARIYRPSFRENKPKTLVFSHRKRAFWACFHENWVYKFRHWFLTPSPFPPFQSFERVADANKSAFSANFVNNILAKTLLCGPPKKDLSTAQADYSCPVSTCSNA
jgi:hypothetical protein